MNLLLLVGMFACSGCGNTAYTPYLAVAGIVERGPVRMTVAWDGADKAHTGNGYHIGSGGSLRFGKHWFAGPGAEWSRQVTPLWTKDAAYGSITAGYRRDGNEAWLSASAPISGHRDSRYSIGGGAQIQVEAGPVFRFELSHGGYPGGNYNALSIFGGWRWD